MLANNIHSQNYINLIPDTFADLFTNMHRSHNAVRRRKIVDRN